MVKVSICMVRDSRPSQDFGAGGSFSGVRTGKHSKLPSGPERYSGYLPCFHNACTERICRALGLTAGLRILVTLCPFSAKLTSTTSGISSFVVFSMASSGNMDMTDWRHRIAVTEWPHVKTARVYRWYGSGKQRARGHTAYAYIRGLVW